jgi:hypothetical protein
MTKYERKKSINNVDNTIEQFRIPINLPRNHKGFLERYILVYFPFFIRIPIETFLWLISKGFKNPIYFLVLFALFAFIKKVVRSNTYEWSYYT